MRLCSETKLGQQYRFGGLERSTWGGFLRKKKYCLGLGLLDSQSDPSDRVLPFRFLGTEQIIYLLSQGCILNYFLNLILIKKSPSVFVQNYLVFTLN